MKQRLICFCLSLLCLSLLLTGCRKKTLELTYYPESGNYYDSKNDVTYLRAELYYEALSLRRDLPVAHIPNKKMDDTILYQIEGAEPTEMLANEYFEIYYTQDMTLPTLAEMKVDRIYVGSVVEGAIMDLAVATIEDAEDIDAVISCYQSGPFFHEENRFDEGTVTDAYRLRFTSLQHPAFCYRLSYYQYAEDVLIYEQIESEELHTPTYSGVGMHFMEHSGQLYAVYNFGKNIVYDHVTGNCYAAGDTIAKHLSTTD